MTLTLDEAKAVALRWARATFEPLEEGDAVALYPEVREYDCGWLFTYNSERFIETGDFEFMLMGNAPVAVRKSDGATTTFATGMNIEEIDRVLRQGWPPPRAVAGG